MVSADALVGALDTLDVPFLIDYVGTDIPNRWTDLQHLIAEIAAEVDPKIDAVPYDEMIPLPRDSVQRQIPVGTYGRIPAFVIDPYAMALGKPERGFSKDLEDIVFLVRTNLNTLRNSCMTQSRMQLSTT